MQAKIMKTAAIMADAGPRTPAGSLGGLMLGALGVIYGDIGTSPLYTLKTALEWAGGATPEVAIGMLSLIVWTLLITTSLKYVTVVMRADNDGEGGILALMSLLGIKHGERIVVIAIGILGAALLYGDGAITPAISVLSALEGLKIPAPQIAPYIVPMSALFLVGLFALQSQGSERIGKLFGPIMTIWFVTIGLLGLGGILSHPGVLVALDPSYGLAYLFTHGFTGFLVLGAVCLCATGVEALYADMGHFGPRPIRFTWYGLVLPMLLLNYAGQAAAVVEGAVVADANPFFILCPSPLQVPLVVLATLATIIASQAIISGAFSMTRQAIQLGWCPRLRITQTSRQGYGQIYVGTVNWLLMIVTVGLALGFRKSDNLAAAYGIAVSLTMLLTTVLLFIAMREIWQWNVVAAAAVAGCFAIVDGGFVASNSMKIAEGGWVPLVLATIVWCIMAIWHRGTVAVGEALQDRAVPIEQFIAEIAARNIPRVPGTAVFLTREPKNTPPVMLWHIKNNRALHQHVIAINCLTKSVPFVDQCDRIDLEQLAPDFWRMVAYYGFMARPDIPA